MLYFHPFPCLQTFIETTSNIHSKERLIQVFIDTMRCMGFDRLNFSVLRDDWLPPAECRFGIISTYPKDWQDYYADQDLSLIDPVLRCAVGSSRPFTWREIEARYTLSRRQVRFFREGEEAGLYNGIGIPFAGPRQQVGGIALAMSSPSNDVSTQLDLIAAFCHQFYMCYKRLVSEPLVIRPSFATLSTREREILTWIGRGKSAEEIGELLPISTNTVNYHTRRIFNKLHVKTRIEAVVFALTHRLIDL